MGADFTFCHYYHAISRSHHLDRDTFLIAFKKLILYKETLKVDHPSSSAPWL